jgi:cation diffusion facilitator CzcD-associated flavoprotein CzcO
MPPVKDITIVGAGPHGLAVLLHLLAADATRRDRITVIDPTGCWLRTWHEAFARLDISTLRSPAVHHPSPDPDELLRFTRAHRCGSSGLPYDIPEQATFAACCAHLVATHDLTDTVVAARLLDVLPGHRHLDLVTDHGLLSTRRLVLAGNPHRRTIPAWVYGLLPAPPALVAHADDVDLRGLDLTDQRIAVIGGGLTAAHLVLGAIGRGAKVEWITRRPVTSRMFDVEPGWLGPKHLDRFAATPDPADRLQMARDARGGGSVPPWMLERLDAHARRHAVDRHTSDVVDATLEGDRARLDTAEGGSLPVDRVWLATGTVASLDACPSLRRVRDDIPTVDGHPVPDRDLRIGPHPIHVAGRLATIELGPAAGNLWGAQRAAAAIARVCTGVDLDVELAPGRAG